MEEGPQYPRDREAGREHIPLYPKRFIICRYVQLFFALASTALTAYGVHTQVYAADCILLFTAGASVISCIYFIVADKVAPSIYNYWAVMALEIFLVILWPIAFSLLGNVIAPYLNGYTYCEYYVGCYTRGLNKAEKAYAYTLGTAAIIGIVELVMFVISLSIHGTMVYRHRAAGLHCTPGAISGQPAAVTAAPVNEKSGSVRGMSSEVEPPLPTYTIDDASSQGQGVYVPQSNGHRAGGLAAAQPSVGAVRPVSQRSGRSAHSARSHGHNMTAA